VNLKEKLWTPDEPKLVEGKVCLELFDERTGRLQEQVKATNYVTDVMTGALRWSSRQFLLHLTITAGGATSANTDPPPHVPFPGINSYNSASSSSMGFWLTDASNAENASADRFIAGKMCAWSLCSTYAGGDAFRGTFNQVESSRQNTKDIFVIDWPTNSGNGTVNSVYTISGPVQPSYAGNNLLYFSDNFLGIPVPGYGDTWADSWAGVSGTGVVQGLYLDPDGVSYWTMTSATQLVKRTLGTGAVVTTINLTGISGSVYGFCNDGSGAVGNWWVSTSTPTIYKFAAAGGAPLNTYTSRPSYGVLAFGGGYLWMYGASNTMYQLDPATTNTITSFVMGVQPGSTIGGTGGASSVPTPLIYHPDATNGDELWSLTSMYDGSNPENMIGRWSTSGIGRGTYYPAATYGLSYYYQFQGGHAITPGGVYVVNQLITTSQSNTYRLGNTRQFIARSLLPGAVTKSNTQTMKLTYEFDYS